MAWSSSMRKVFYYPPYCPRFLPMSASPVHALTRLTRVSVALVTVWCLGCGAFEPLVSSLTRGTTGAMNCDSEQTVKIASATAAEGIGASQVQTIVAVDRHEQGSYSCSCESCYSVSPVMVSFGLWSAPLPQAITQTVPSFESVKREPLVPPPQALS